MNVRKRIVYKNFFGLLLVVATLFLGIGYATVNSIVLNIDGSVSGKISSDVYIYDAIVIEDSDDNTGGKINLSHQTMLSSEVVLSNIDINSSVTLQISIRNSSSVDQMFEGVKYLSDGTTYSNENITFYLTGLEEGDILKSGDNIIFTITFHYKDKSTVDNNILKSFVDFDFQLNPSPVLSDNMIPVYYESNQWKKTNVNSEKWHSYYSGKWANAVTYNHNLAYNLATNNNDLKKFNGQVIMLF